MHILLIAPQPFYEDRGTPIAIREELEALSNLGFVVEVATYPVGAQVKISRVKIIRTSNPLNYKSVPIGLSFRKIVLDICLFITVLRLVCRNDYDCIHAVEESAFIAIICKLLFGLPVVYDMHSNFPDQISGKKGSPLVCIWKWFSSRFEKLLVKHSDCIITSRGLASYVLTIEPGKAVWECFFNGGKPGQRNEQLAHNLGIANTPTVGYIGTFASYQGLETLIEAATLVHEEIPEVAFILVGGTENEISYLKQIVIEHKLEGTLLLIPRRPRQEVSDYIALADVLVLPRLTGKNAPLKIYEYLRSGKAIVATDISAHTTVLSDKIAILVAPGTEALAKGILCAFHDSEHTKKIVQAAEIVLGSLENKSLDTTMEEVYQFVANKRQN